MWGDEETEASLFSNVFVQPALHHKDTSELPVGHWRSVFAVSLKNPKPWPFAVLFWGP